MNSKSSTFWEPTQGQQVSWAEGNAQADSKALVGHLGLRGAVNSPACHKLQLFMKCCLDDLEAVGHTARF